MVFWLRHNFARGGREGGINLIIIRRTNNTASLLRLGNSETSFFNLISSKFMGLSFIKGVQANQGCLGTMQYPKYFRQVYS
jgi:hypothetical protein